MKKIILALALTFTITVNAQMFAQSIPECSPCRPGPAAQPGTAAWVNEQLTGADYLYNTGQINWWIWNAVYVYLWINDYASLADALSIFGDADSVESGAQSNGDQED